MVQPWPAANAGVTLDASTRASGEGPRHGIVLHVTQADRTHDPSAPERYIVGYPDGSRIECRRDDLALARHGPVGFQAAYRPQDVASLQHVILEVPGAADVVRLHGRPARPATHLPTARGIYVAPAIHWLGLPAASPPPVVQAAPAATDEDWRYHEIGTAMQGALTGHPDLLRLLWCERPRYTTPLADRWRALGPRLVSLVAVQGALGAALDWLERPVFAAEQYDTWWPHTEAIARYAVQLAAEEDDDAVRALGPVLMVEAVSGARRTTPCPPAEEDLPGPAQPALPIEVPPVVAVEVIRHCYGAIHLLRHGAPLLEPDPTLRGLLEEVVTMPMTYEALQELALVELWAEMEVARETTSLPPHPDYEAAHLFLAAARASSMTAAVPGT